MIGYPLETLALVAGAVGVGGIVKGITGIGLPIVSIAILVTFLEPKLTLAVVVVPILVTNLWQAVTAHDWRAPFQRFWPMILCFLAALLVGAQLVVDLQAAVLFGILGISVSIFAASNLVRPRPHPLSPAAEKWAGPVAGTLGGLLGGLTTIWGPPMMMYFVLLKLSKDDWVQTVGMIWFLGAVPLTISYWNNGVLNPDTVKLSVYACIPGMLGIWIGEVVRRRINQETFRKVMLVILFLIGLNLIRRAIF